MSERAESINFLSFTLAILYTLIFMYYVENYLEIKNTYVFIISYVAIPLLIFSIILELLISLEKVLNYFLITLLQILLYISALKLVLSLKSDEKNLIISILVALFVYLSLTFLIILPVFIVYILEKVFKLNLKNKSL